MRARVMQLWQTRLLRFTKLTVADEIENALSYYEATFLREIPKLYAELEQALPGQPIASFLRMGQWIGGDRDGNPNVTAQTLEHALTRQSDVALRHYLTEVHFLGGELSLSAMLVPFGPEMLALAERSPDTNEHRQDEPYRRALTGMYARLAATLKQLTGGDAARHAVAPQNPYASAEDFLADLRTIEASLCSHHAEAVAAQRLHPLIRAVEVFGFHLATVDLRQSSDQHEEVVAELLTTARVEKNYSQLDEHAKQALLLGLLNDARPLRVPGADYSGHTLSELAIFDTAQRMLRSFRQAGHSPLHHQPHRNRERLAGSAAAAKRSGPAARHAGRASAQRPDRGAPVRDHRRPAQRRAHHARLLRPARRGRAGPALGWRARHHAGLFGQQQRRRHLHQQLGAVPRRNRLGRAV
jgi:phosphoenolpyruvate carboxylase